MPSLCLADGLERKIANGLNRRMDTMADLICVVAASAFFLIAMGYTFGCDRLSAKGAK